MKLEIIASLDGQKHYSQQQIETLLNQQQTALHYGATFMGRPGTHLYVSETEVIKLRNEFDLNEKSARRLLAHTLEQEKKLFVHHPHKTWFLIHKPDDTFKIGNICPRLTPLHTLKEQTRAEITTKFIYLEKLYRCYFEIASRFSARLDEGLSNFGIDEEGELYYLDDDIYSWDNFVSFSHILGVLIRNNAWIDDNYAVILGCQLRQLISEFFEDSHTNIMVARKLRDIFMPDKNRRYAFDRVIEQLQEKKVISKKVTPFNQNRIAILSDIHANLPALEAVLDYLAAQNITQGIVLGDTVGYGPHPGECIDLLQKTQLQVIKGNHDHAAAIGDTNQGMSILAKWCIDWTIPRLTPEQRKWLNDLPLELESPDDVQYNWQAVHGAPMDPNYFYAYIYQMTYEENLDVMAERSLNLCFHGHSHVQGLYVRYINGLDGFVKPESRLSLDIFEHALVCPGAVGQPRDGDVGAQFIIYDRDKAELEFFCVDYDMEKTITDMQNHGFHRSLWERLRRGI